MRPGREFRRFCQSYVIWFHDLDLFTRRVSRVSRVTAPFNCGSNIHPTLSLSTLCCGTEGAYDGGSYHVEHPDMNFAVERSARICFVTFRESTFPFPELLPRDTNCKVSSQAVSTLQIKCHRAACYHPYRRHALVKHLKLSVFPGYTNSCAIEVD